MIPRPDAASCRPPASTPLPADRREGSVADALAAAPARTCGSPPIAVPDGPWQATQRGPAGCDGPHRVVPDRDPVERGVGTRPSRRVGPSAVEMLYVTARP